MDVEYTGRQTTITKKLKLQAEAGLARIVKIAGNSGSVHVILSTDKYRQIADAYGADQAPEACGALRGD